MGQESRAGVGDMAYGEGLDDLGYRGEQATAEPQAPGENFGPFA